MTVNLQQFEHDQSPYERPEQKWVCGWASQGRPCRVGPDLRGRCRATAECRPVRRGDRWICTRPAAAGGTCEDGPRPDGQCCRPVPRCQPVLSIRSRRRLTVVLCCLAIIGLLAAALGGPWRLTVISAGPLSMSHAQLEQDCTACHSAANEALVGMLVASISPPDAAIESEHCLACHDVGVSPLSPHGAAPARMLALSEKAARTPLGTSRPWLASAARLLEDRTGDHASLACAVCHVEHRGRRAGLATMETLRCQSCHQRQFRSFSQGHPEFSASYPTARRTRIQFNHRTHLLGHFEESDWEGFASSNPAESCRACHVPDARAERMLTSGFETSCGRCHQHRRQIAGDEGAGASIALFGLPWLDLETMVDEDLWLGDDPWPADALNDEYPLPVFTRLLLAHDPQAAADLKLIEESGISLAELYDAEEPEVLGAVAARLAWAVKVLLHDLTEDGESAFIERLGLETDDPLSAMKVDALLGQPSDRPGADGGDWHAALTALRETALPSLDADVTAYREDPDRLRDQGANEDEADLEVEDDETTRPGWLVDFQTMSVRYRPAGHADPFLRAWLDHATNGAATSPRLAEVFAMLRDPAAPGRCMKCHTVEVDATQTPPLVSINWMAARPAFGDRTFTRFAHRPHLGFDQFRDCTSCHALGERDPESDRRWRESYQGDQVDRFEPSFAPIAANTCRQCHTTDGAGEGCLNCHRYHVGRRLLPRPGLAHHHAHPAAPLLTALDDPDVAPARSGTTRRELPARMTP